MKPGGDRFLLAMLALPVLLLVGCEQDTIIQARYECEKGEILNTTFTNGRQVTVKLEDGQSFTIDRVAAESGTKYESEAEGVSFWVKGIDASFKMSEGAPPLNCRRK